MFESQTIERSAQSHPSREEIVFRATSMRARLQDLQQETEERTYYSEEIHRVFGDSGFYKILTPKRFGGLELDILTYFKVVVELSRGCPSTGWQFCLGSAHAPTLCAIYPESVLEELFADGNSICAATVRPQGYVKLQSDGNWKLEGTYNYCSGIPYSSHFMGHAFIKEADSGGGPMTFIAPRDQWTRLDDWGNRLGLKGSGSHSIQFTNAVLPKSYGLPGVDILRHEPMEGTSENIARSSNPMFYGRALALFNIEAAALAVGQIKGALDEYGKQMISKGTPTPPVISRSLDADYRRRFGLAVLKATLAETALEGVCARWTEAARQQMCGEQPFTAEEELKIGGTAYQIANICWEVMEGILWPTVGSSAAIDGERMQRIYRDMSMARTHALNTQMDGMARTLSDQVLLPLQ